MRCPNCGEEVESERTPFCPHCGQNLTGGRSRRKLRFILMDVQEGRRFRHLASAAVITIVIAAVLSVLLVQWDDPDGNGLGPGATNVTGPSDDAIIVSDREYVELFGDFEDGDLLASMTDAGEMRISLDPRSSSGFDTFSWVLKNDSNGTYETITKDTGTYPDATSINWISPGIGRYTVTVSCSSAVTGETAVYMGWFVFYGDHHMQYSFVHDGVPYTVYIDVSLEEYLYASGSGGPRGTSSVSEASTFVTESPSVKALAGRLSDAYMKTHGGEIGDRSDYAAFILDFVQSCLGETSDTVLYNKAVYWAYPAETLYNGAGDSGDLSVLTASLLRASGFGSGLATVHGHVMALVSLDIYEEPSDIPYGYHVVHVTAGGERYLLCETTAEVPLGCVGTAYDYRGGTFRYYGEDASGDSGLWVSD